MKRLLAKALKNRFEMAKEDAIALAKTVEAIFDGEVLRPDGPLTLKPNTRVRITIETVEQATEKPKSFLQTARSLNIEGPPDWAKNIDAYIYGGKNVKRIDPRPQAGILP